MRRFPIKAWRWTCPHCGVAAMRLPSADRHLKRKHYDCWSCKTERVLIQSMMRGEGMFVEGPLPFGRPLSTSLDRLPSSAVT